MSSTNDNHSPVSHGCRTPIKKAKLPPNYGGYDEEHSDGLNTIVNKRTLLQFFFLYRRIQTLFCS